MRTAIYAGTFDPVTQGHLSVVDRAAAIFDRVIVLLAVNPEKTALFTLEERLEMLRESVEQMGSAQNVQCGSTTGWVVDYARAHGARFLVRGVRGATDADYETALAHANQAIAPEVTTVFLPAHPELSQVSSTRLKALVASGADVSRFCTPGVAHRLRLRLATPPAHEEVEDGR